jgi:hypothetical protein
MGDQNLGEARNLEVGLAKGGPDIGKIMEEGVFHHPDRGIIQFTAPNIAPIYPSTEGPRPNRRRVGGLNRRERRLQGEPPEIFS